jgi:hypothetical protein
MDSYGSFKKMDSCGDLTTKLWHYDDIYTYYNKRLTPCSWIRDITKEKHKQSMLSPLQLGPTWSTDWKSTKRLLHLSHNT